MIEKNYKDDARKLHQLRRAISKSLPIENSLIPLDLLLEASIGNDLNNHSIKSLFISLPHSNMGLRYYFQQLIDSNFLEINNSETDKRIKIVAPSYLLKKQLQEISQHVHDIYN
jgi:hypothetical protein